MISAIYGFLTLEKFYENIDQNRKKVLVIISIIYERINKQYKHSVLLFLCDYDEK